MVKRASQYVKENKLGTLALVLAHTFMFLGLPAQIVKIWETRSVKDISVLTFTLLAVQSIAWVAYGAQRRDWPVIISNSFGMFFSSIIVILYFLFK